MHRLFGKPKPKVEAPTLEDASSGINARVEYLDKQINGLDNELRKYKEQLKTAKGPTANGIKKRAMDVLKRKRMYEAQRDQMAGQQFNIDQTSFAIETVKNTQTTVAAMSAAAKTLKVENKKIDLGAVEDTMDDMEDMLEDVGEINDLLGRSYGVPDGVDECDLDAELACLEDGADFGLGELDAEPTAASSTGATAQPSYMPDLPAQPATSVFSGPEAMQAGAVQPAQI